MYKMLKNLAKALTPSFAYERIQIIHSATRRLSFKGLSNQEIFSKVYEKSLWGKSTDPENLYYSGSGSHDEIVTGVYIDAVCDFLEKLPEKPDVVDLGCGDFSIGSKIRASCNSFIACDVVPQLIAHNRRRYGDLGVDFRHLDIINEDLPHGDIVFIRQVLQHLSNEQINKLIPKILLRYKFLVLTEHLPKSNVFVPNLDQAPGPDIRIARNSGIVLTAPPFNMQALNAAFICEAEEADGVIRTIIYRLK